MKTHLVINGACGRMGQRLVALAQEDHSLVVAAAIDSPNHPKCGTDDGELAGIGRIGVPVTGDIPLSARIDCVIDFSVPAGTTAVLRTCVDRKLPLVVATTGHEPHEVRAIESAAHETAVLFAPNMSL